MYLPSQRGVGEVSWMMGASQLTAPPEQHEHLAALACKMCTGSSSGALQSQGCHCCADISLVVEGQLYVPGCRRLPYGGQDVTRRLQSLLSTGQDSKAMRLGELERLKHKIMHFAMPAPQTPPRVRCFLAPFCRSGFWFVRSAHVKK